MRRTLWRAAGGCALALALVSSGQAQPAGPSPATGAAQADTPEVTPGGAGFTVPKDWTVRRGADWIAATAPEGRFEMAVVDVAGARDGDEAAARAWARFRPQMTRRVELSVVVPPQLGWEGGKQLNYQVSPNERRQVAAVALKSGEQWAVLLLDGDLGVIEKRQAGMALILSSLRRTAYRKESFAGKTAHRLDPERVVALKAYVEGAMQALGVPGVSMALIDHGQVVFEGGFGVRELGRPEPVDAHTLFMIASNTKGMSTLLLARLVDQGKLSWDDPVSRVYPGFRLGDEAATRQVLVRHLVCACTGLPRKDMEWIFNTPRGTQASTTFDQLAATQPTSGFGEVFQYNNLMASAAGYIGGHLVHPDREIGAAYDAAMQELIFDPLGMGETTFDFARALKGDHASPHAIDLDGVERVASMDLNYEIIPFRPAGGAWSSAHDMIAYVRNELDEGRLPDGRRLLSARNLLARRAPSVPLAEGSFYGMGLQVDGGWGVKVIHHSGSLAGFKSDWFAVPEAGVGAVILTNSDEGGVLIGQFQRRLLEVLYDGEPQAEGWMQASANAQKAATARIRQVVTSPPEPAAVAALAGRYANPELGRLQVVKEGSGVVFDFGPWRSRIVSRRNPDGTVSFATSDPGVPHANFIVGQAAGRRTLTVRDGQHEYVYAETL